MDKANSIFKKSNLHIAKILEITNSNNLEIDKNNISEDRKSLEKGNISISALTPILYSHDNNDIARSWTKKLNN